MLTISSFDDDKFDFAFSIKSSILNVIALEVVISGDVVDDETGECGLDCSVLFGNLFRPVDELLTAGK